MRRLGSSFLTREKDGKGVLDKPERHKSILVIINALEIHQELDNNQYFTHTIIAPRQGRKGPACQREER